MKNVEKVLSRIEEYPSLKRLILITDPWLDYSEVKAKIVSAGRNFYTFNEVCELGSKNVLPYPKIDPESIHYICYSSGTTGTPKGVIISHRSQTSNTLNCYDGLDFRSDEVHLSYLPLPHVFERIGISVYQLVGGRIGFFSGSISLLTEDMQIQLYGDPNNKDALDLAEKGLKQFKNQKIIIFDTAGRHKNEEDLIEEMNKIIINRIIIRIFNSLVITIYYSISIRRNFIFYLI